MTFDELHRSLLLRPEYGMLKHRKSIEREIWNCALENARHSLIIQMNERFNKFEWWQIAVSEIETSMDEIEKLKE